MLHKSNDCRICEPPILPTRWIYLLHTSNNVRCGGKLFVGNSGALHTGIALLNVLRTDVYPRPFEQGRKYDVQEFSISEEKGDNLSSSLSCFVYIRRLLEKIADFHSAPLTISKGWPGVV